MNNQMKVTSKDIASAKSTVCDKCSCDTFKNLFLIKTISALMSPTGKEINVPIPVFGCSKCGHVNESFLPDLT